MQRRMEQLSGAATLSDVFEIAHDGNFGTNAKTSRLVLELQSSVHVASYELYTARDAQRRDPISWQFGLLYGAGTGSETFEVLSSYSGVLPTGGRSASYGQRFYTFAPPPPPSPPPMGQVFQFRFSALGGRAGGGTDGGGAEGG